MPLPFPYNLTNQPQLQKRREIFFGADKFASTGTAPTLTRSAKGNIFAALAASASTHFFTSMPFPLDEFTPSPVNYAYKGKSWAFNVNYAQAIYLVNTANLTSATLGLSYSTFSASAATPTVVDILAPSNLTLTFGADIIISQVAPANPAVVAPFGSELLLELDIVVASGGTADFYGVLLDIMTD